MAPRVVIGVPLFDRVDQLESAVGSLLAQTGPELALVLVDDASGDRTPEVARALAGTDPRIEYVRNAQRLGMTANWRRCVELARERFPSAEYFAWGSDHDLWEPDWLGALVGALDAEPTAVLAYPRFDGIDERGQVVTPARVELETTGTPDVRARARATHRGMSAGNMVYGLFRVEPLLAAGVLRDVLGPDRLLLVELSYRGTFVQVPRVLWHRRFRKLFSTGRQRAAIFAGSAPAYSYLPVWLTHAAVLAWLYVVRGIGRPGVGRRLAALLCWDFLVVTGQQLAAKRRSRAWHLYKFKLRRPARHAARRAKRWTRAFRARVAK